MKTCKQLWAVLLVAFVMFLQTGRALAQDDQNQPPNNDAQGADVQNGPSNDASGPDAQAPDAQADEQNAPDPPGRVARLDFSQGSVSFRPAGDNDWVSGVPNRPMVTGDDLWADDNSRAEVHIGSTAIRLGAKTGITFLTLDDHTTQIRLAQGSMILRVRHVDEDDTYEVDAPNLAFSVLQPGEYRFDVSEDGTQTTTTVWSGRGRVTGGGFTYTVVAHQKAVFTGTDQLNYDLDQVPDADDFDRWAFERDDREDHSDSANYVSREMTGYEDLDEYGQWSYVAGYGPCWRPRLVAAGWAPYRMGHWVFVRPWGWTWVDDEPWGFAPFHYGRWAFVGGGWFWVPGPVAVRPVWAPALVAWVGGPGFHVGVGVGVGWFPLAPGEVFVPAYHVSRVYVNNINITNTNVTVTRVTNVYNTTIINNRTNVERVTYVNQHVNGGVTVVSRDTFVNARPVAQNVVHVDQRQLEAAAPATHFTPAQPVRASVVGAGRPVAARPPAAVINRQVVAERMPARTFGEPAGRNQPIVRQQPSRPVEPQPGHPAQPQNQEGFRPFNQPNQGNMNRPEPQPSRAPQQDQMRPENTPLVRPAPPVQSNPQHEQQQEQKFRNWQQQRPAAPPRQQEHAAPAQHPQHSAPPKQDHHKGR